MVTPSQQSLTLNHTRIVNLNGHESGKNSVAGALRGVKINNGHASQSIFYKNSGNGGKSKKRYGKQHHRNATMSTLPFSNSNRYSNDAGKAKHLQVMGQLGNIYRLKDKLVS